MVRAYGKMIGLRSVEGLFTKVATFQPHVTLVLVEVFDGESCGAMVRLPRTESISLRFHSIQQSRCNPPQLAPV